LTRLKQQHEPECHRERRIEGEPDVAGGRRSFLWLTEGEAQAFTEEMRTVIDRYVDDRDATNHPADTEAPRLRARGRPRSGLGLTPDTPVEGDQYVESRASRTAWCSAARSSQHRWSPPDAKKASVYDYFAYEVHSHPTLESLVRLDQLNHTQ
jgi:hypothetical protein